MKFIVGIAFYILAFSSLGAEAVVARAADLARLVYRDQRPGITFELDCTVMADKITDGETRLHLLDETGAVILFTQYTMSNVTWRAGDRVHVKGRTQRQVYNKVIAICQIIEKTGSGPAPQPEDATAYEIDSGRLDCHFVRIHGTLRDVFQDEIDRNFTYLVLYCDGKIIYAPAPRFEIDDGMVGAEIEIAGICDPMPIGGRHHMGRIVLINDSRAIKVMQASGKDIFDAPIIEDATFLGPMEIQTLGIRRARGTVMAAWQPRHILISTKRGNLISASLANQSLPSAGATVEVVGVPETDLFNIILSRAVWRPADCSPTAMPDAKDISVEQLLGKSSDDRVLNPYFNGMTVRVKGSVIGLEPYAGSAGTILISEGGRILTVDSSSVPEVADDVAVGCKIEATGVCILETENWRPSALFPPASGYRVVIRRPGELRILARPPWWTVEKLLVVIGILSSILAMLLIRLAVKRRFRAMIAKAKANARVGERTRLAVELHDSIAQNLTGVAMEIRSARRAQTVDPSRIGIHLDLAAATLDSCRDELRNCIWDLRNLTLDDATVNEAISRTLRQHLSGAHLEVRFNVARALLSDNALHTILRVVRELTINAVRHGEATEIRIAGLIDNGSLLFSVRDNGHGFDPASAPGMREGHFGLQGLRERIEAMEGNVEIESHVNRGTKIAFSIPLSSVRKDDVQWAK